MLPGSLEIIPENCPLDPVGRLSISLDTDNCLLELEPVEGDGKTEAKVDFKLDVEVDPNTPGKEPLTTHLEGQVAHNVLLMHLLTDSPQVEGNEMDVEMEGKTKDDGNVVLEGSVQQGKDQVEKH